ncbi:hypothetical protein FK535_09840 [Mycolicibacterium sp. 018/SC-01/001]|uniref:hypothetical protein n=1 Tax=Mycolicibacterium sp. 018/SC-01/001 TaxID=2592069 RepID=UPI00117C62E5|nr:hypothetical protein [Mycolicibacterium sp. 018/SC-01/001]TRW84783.1 hypothetical protein FK535_09840 [Mycolicibacterium sp. 018/SC-01/001]
MQKVVDPDGVTWRIRRWWWNTVPWQTGFDTLDAIFWSIRIERDGHEVARERMTGWRASDDRIAAVAEQAKAGTLAHSLGLESTV